MSYDLQFFQLRDGVNLEEVNEYLAARQMQEESDEDEEIEDEEIEDQDEEDEDEEDEDDEDDDDDDDPPLPDRFVNTELSREDLILCLGRAYLKFNVPEAEQSSELKAFLASDEQREFPEEWQEYMEDFFEWSGTPGMQPVLFSYGGDLRTMMDLLADMLEKLQPQRIALYDPQIDKVVDGTNARQMLL